MLKPRAKPGSFGTPSPITKFGSERLPVDKLPAVATRELVLIEPTGKVRYFTSYADDLKNPDPVVMRAIGMSLSTALASGWLAIHNNSARMPTLTLQSGYDIRVMQLAPLRSALARYKDNLAVIMVRAYDPTIRGYKALGQFRTAWGAEMSARGG